MLTLSGDVGVVGPGLAAVGVAGASDAGAVPGDVEIVGDMGVLVADKKVLEKRSYGGLRRWWGRRRRRRRREEEGS